MIDDSRTRPRPPSTSSLGNWMTRGYDVLVDDDGMATLRRLDRQHALIFLISHRSYLDEFVLPPALSTTRPCPQAIPATAG